MSFDSAGRRAREPYLLRGWRHGLDQVSIQAFERAPAKAHSSWQE